MRILIAPDKFKGSLSAMDAARAIAAGWKAAAPESEISFAPIADGGEGFAATLCEALGGAWIETKAHDPLGRPIAARYAWIESEKLAVLDMSEASGLRLLSAAERDPLRANTFGTGELIRHATERGAATILVGLGGSATTDAGTGMAAALGYELYTSDGEPLPHAAWPPPRFDADRHAQGASPSQDRRRLRRSKSSPRSARHRASSLRRKKARMPKLSRHSKRPWRMWPAS